MTSIAELGIKVDSTDAAQASSDLDKLTAAGGRAEKAAEGVAKGADKASASIKKQKDELSDLLGEIDPTVKALGRLDELESKLAKQKKLGALDASTFSEYQSKIDQSRANLSRFDDSLTRTGNTAKQTAAALRGVPAQFTDIAVSLQGGQAPLTVLLQQGGQLKDMFGGIGPAARAMGGYILGLVNPYTVAAAAVGALTLAYYKGSQEADEYNKAIIFTGNSAGTSATQLASMAQQVSATVGTTGAAAEVLAKLAGSGKIASGSFEEITKAALQMEKATGKAIDETVAEFAKIAKDPVAAAKELNDQYNFLTASVYSQIVALKEQGDTIGAAKLLTDTYANTIEERTGQVTQNLGLIESAWNKIKQAASGALDAAKEIGRIQTLEQQAEVIRQRLQTNQGRGGRAAALGLETRDVAKDRGELAFLELQIDAEKSRTKFIGDRVAIERGGIDAAIRLKSISDSNLTNEEKRNKLIKEYKRDVEALRKANPNDPLVQEAVVSKTIQNIKDKNKDPKAPTSAVNLTEFNDSKNQLSLILGEYKNAQKELEAAQKAGLISQEAYAAQRSVLIKAEKEEVTSAYQAEIDALEAAKAKKTTTSAQSIDLDKRIADARSSMVKAQKDADSQLEVLSTTEEGRINKLTAASEAYVAQLERQRAALELSGTRAANGLGLGDRQQGLQNSLDGATDKFNDERAKLLDRRKTAPDKYSKDDYEKDLAALETAENKYRDTVVDNYDKISAAQSDWRNGATSAFSNYLESARNVAGQTRDLFSNAFSSMEDAVVNFAMTGKLSFADFTKSILADMARIATRQASSALLSSLVGAATSYFTGGGATASATAGGAKAGAQSFGSQFDASSASVSFGGGRAVGGGVEPNTFYEVNEKGPELFNQGGRSYLMTGASGGSVTPLTSGGGPALAAMSGTGGGNTYNFPVSVSVQTSGSEGGGVSQEASTQLGKGIQQAAKTEAETAIARALQPGGSIWRLTNGRG
ncbi:MAG: phage tail tape measure protein [Pseudomonas sp.]|nr:phage tail tape measure protein [Pseudomonas sp.]